jgi:hypothetical protein
MTKAHEVLEAAKKELQNRPWIKYELRNDRGGVCAVGAMVFIPSDHDFADVDFFAAEDALNKKAEEYIPPREERISSSTGMSIPCPVAYYNDHVAETKEDVITLYEKTIADLP